MNGLPEVQGRKRRGGVSSLFQILIGILQHWTSNVIDLIYSLDEAVYVINNIISIYTIRTYSIPSTSRDSRSSIQIQAG